MIKRSNESHEVMYHDGRCYVNMNGEWVESSQPIAPSHTSEAVVEEQFVHKPERQRMSRAAIATLGSLVLGMLIIPPAAHYASEGVTNAIINFANPAPDQTVTHDELMSDIGVSLRKMMGGS